MDDALKIVENLEHRAGRDAEGKTGDGVGILTQIPHKFMQKVTKPLGIVLGNEREYGVGMFFFPQREMERSRAKKMFEVVIRKEGLNFLGWREVPVDASVFGTKALECMLGAEEFGFATAPLITMGCVMMRVCNLDTCPMGIATQNPELRKRFSGKPEYVVNFMKFIAENLREYMAKLGIRTIDELVGRSDLLKKKDNLTDYEQKIDLDRILGNPYAGKKDTACIFDPKHEPRKAQWLSWLERRPVTAEVRGPSPLWVVCFKETNMGS